MSNTTIADRQERRARRYAWFAFGAVALGIGFGIAFIWTFESVFPQRWQAVLIVGTLMVVVGAIGWHFRAMVPDDIYAVLRWSSTTQLKMHQAEIGEEVTSREQSGEAGAEMTGRTP